MKDFFKEIYCSMNNLDYNKMKEEDKIREEKEKESVIIINKKTKIFFNVVLFMYFLVTIASLVTAINVMDIIQISKNILLICTDIFTIICLNIKKKSTEIFAIIGFIIIVIVTFAII